jgi:hypothetical protein
MSLLKLAQTLKKAIDYTSKIEDVPQPQTKFSEAEQKALQEKIDFVLYPRWLRASNEEKTRIAQEIQSAIYPYFFNLAMKLFMYNPSLNIAQDTAKEDLGDDAYKYTSHANAEEAADKASLQTIAKLPDYLQEYDGRGSLLGYLTMKYKGEKGNLQGFLGPALSRQKDKDAWSNLSLEDQMPASHRYEDYTNMEVGKGEANRGNVDTFGEKDVSQGMDHVTQILNAPTKYVAYLSELIDKQSGYLARKENHYGELLKRLDYYVKTVNSLIPQNDQNLYNAVERLDSIMNNYSFISPMPFQGSNLFQALSEEPQNFEQVMNDTVNRFKNLSKRDIDKTKIILMKAEDIIPQLFKLSQQLNFDNPGDQERTFVQQIVKLEKLGELGEKHAVKEQSSNLHDELLPHFFAAGGYGEKSGYGENMSLIPSLIRKNISPEDYKLIVDKNYQDVSTAGKWSLMLAKTSMDSSLSKFTAEEPKLARQNFVSQLILNIDNAQFISPEEKPILASRAHELTVTNIDTLKSLGYSAPAIAATRKLKTDKGLEDYSSLTPEEIQEHLKSQLYGTPGYRSLGALSGIEYKQNPKMKRGYSYDPSVVSLDHEDPKNIDTWTRDFARNLSKGREPQPYTMYDDRYKHRKPTSPDKLKRMLETFQSAKEHGAVAPHHKRRIIDTVGTPEPPTTAKALRREILASISELKRRSARFDTFGYGYVAEAIDNIIKDLIM